jgi:hypothetical protein
MEQDGRPEVEASMQRRGKGDEACSVASGKEEKCGGVGGDAIHKSGRRRAKEPIEAGGSQSGARVVSYWVWSRNNTF